jgi:hypothetical protein
MNKPAAVIALALAPFATSCSKQHTADRPQNSNEEVAVRAAPAPPKPAPTVDPKSTAAAEDLVRGLVRLINSGRLNDAYMLFGSNAPSRAEFDRQLAGFTHVTQGAAGDQEGAAGSIYVSIPLTFTGAHSQRRANVILRRVNDVPGSTEAQRHWHIERLDWDQLPRT